MAKKKSKKQVIYEKRQSDLRYRAERAKPFKWIRYYMAFLLVFDVIWFILSYVSGNMLSIIPFILIIFRFIALIGEMRYITGSSDSLKLTYIYHLIHLAINILVSISLIIPIFREKTFSFLGDDKTVLVVLFCVGLLLVILSFLSVRRLNRIRNNK